MIPRLRDRVFACLQSNNRQFILVWPVAVFALPFILAATGPESAGEEPSVPPSVTIKSIEATALADDTPLPDLDESSTIDDYLAYAALRNPQLHAAFEEWKTALYRIPQARSLPDPRFNYGYVIREVETRVGPQEHRVGFSQVFPWFGKLGLKEDIAFEEANAAKQKYDAARARLFYRVKDVYYELYYLHRAIEITGKNMKLLSILESVARTKYQTGGALADTIKAQVELGKLEDRLGTHEDLVGPLSVKFNSVLNRELDAKVPVPNTIVADSAGFSDGELFESLIAHSPELKYLDYRASKESYSVELAAKDFFPDFGFGIDYIVTDDARNPTPDSGKDPIIGMLSINLPIWRDKYRAALGEAKSRYRAVQAERRDKENQLLAEFKMVSYQLRDAERKMKLFRDTLIPKAQQSLNVVQKSYESGKSEFLNLIDGQRLLLEFELSYHRAVANRMQRAAEVDMLIGKPFSTSN